MPKVNEESREQWSMRKGGRNGGYIGKVGRNGGYMGKVGSNAS